MDALDINQLIKNIELYDAHTLTDEHKNIVCREKLSEHIERTDSYFRKLLEQKRVDEMLERFCVQTWVDITDAGKLFWKDMINGIPVFHDLGKINSAFQSKAMGNEKTKNINVFHGIGSRHSLISSVLYLDYYMRELCKKVPKKEERKRLKYYMFLHAYVIERHHSDLNDFENFLKSLETNHGMEVIESCQSGQCKAYQSTFAQFQDRMCAWVKEIQNIWENERKSEDYTADYIYSKMLYSLLVASDYYATSEFMNGNEVEQFEENNALSEWSKLYEQTELMQKIRTYQRTQYPRTSDEIQNESKINPLRTEMLCDAEETFKENSNENLFYLEAPTGSGKSNTSIDLSFQMISKDSRLQKIFYIYPFNTLVEQNRQSLQKIFAQNEKVLDSIAVINSITPIKMTKKEKQKEEETEATDYYQRALLDRQFLNYPMILSTHVSLFHTMFGDSKESAFAFYQLSNSVIILDEIQSYKNTIWGEIICFLKEFAYLLNIKVIIMSATLPDLDFLSDTMVPAVHLIKEREKYFSHRLFKDRVEVLYDLLDVEDVQTALLSHIKSAVKAKKKILVEFIKKKTAQEFFEELKEDKTIMCPVEYMSGEDSLMERSRILKEIEHVEGAFVLVATQVIEAGVDIDMDEGYKNISKLDSEEQFLGRINRSGRKCGKVYFFKIDDGKRIYGEDVRIAKPFTLETEVIREYLVNKNFGTYYKKILEVIRRNYMERVGEEGIASFFKDAVGKINLPEVKRHMELIKDDNWSMSVYLAREIIMENGEVLDGKRLWEQYAALLNDFKMGYAEKRVKLSIITSKMNCFIYQIKRNTNLIYNDKIGEIFYIEDGEKYFQNGKLNREMIQGELGGFVDFI